MILCLVMGLGNLALIGSALCLLIPAVYLLSRYIVKRRKLSRKLGVLMDSEDQYEFLLLDIRPSRLYERGHIPGAVSFPLDEMDYLPVEDMFLSIVVYGRRHRDTSRAADYLSRYGYFNVFDYGSVRRWRGGLEIGPGQHISQLPPKKEPDFGN